MQKCWSIVENDDSENQFLCQQFYLFSSFVNAKTVKVRPKSQKKGELVLVLR